MDLPVTARWPRRRTTTTTTTESRAWREKPRRSRRRSHCAEVTARRGRGSKRKARPGDSRARAPRPLPRARGVIDSAAIGTYRETIIPTASGARAWRRLPDALRRPPAAPLARVVRLRRDGGSFLLSRASRPIDGHRGVAADRLALGNVQRGVAPQPLPPRSTPQVAPWPGATAALPGPMARSEPKPSRPAARRSRDSTIDGETVARGTRRCRRSSGRSPLRRDPAQPPPRGPALLCADLLFPTWHPPNAATRGRDKPLMARGRRIASRRAASGASSSWRDQAPAARALARRGRWRCRPKRVLRRHGPSLSRSARRSWRRCWRARISAVRRPCPRCGALSDAHQRPCVVAACSTAGHHAPGSVRHARGVASRFIQPFGASEASSRVRRGNDRAKTLERRQS